MDGGHIMRNRGTLLGLFTITCLVAASELFAYFDGDFDIQRHFLPKEENMID